MSVKRSTVRKYIVTLSAEERERLQTVIRSGKHPARKLLRARILLKTDASEVGDAWIDDQIASALTPVSRRSRACVSSLSRKGLKAC